MYAVYIFDCVMEVGVLLHRKWLQLFSVFCDMCVKIQYNIWAHYSSWSTEA